VENGLPEISYNISAGYVNVNLNLRSKFNSIEVFRGPINFCLVMNKLAPTNSIIIGQDLHAIFNYHSVKNGFRFKNYQIYITEINRRTLFIWSLYRSVDDIIQVLNTSIAY
jgi:hypothetical protein